MTAAASHPGTTLRSAKQPRLIDGKYVVVGTLGQGATGTVYEAENAAVGKRVAVKVLHDELARSEDVRWRFVAEARAAAKIAHANVADVHDLGVTDEGLSYMVMELLTGETLEEIVTSRALPVPYACELMLQVLAGLAAAHRVGIVHRDLKPANVFVTHPRPDRPLVKVLDFGIAKGVLASGHGPNEDGLLLGTPLYMAPEQALRPDVDARADVYSAGVILYEMLAGTPPFVGKTVTEVIAAALVGNARPLRSRNPAVPEDLARAVHEAMAHHAEDRPRSAREFAERIAPFAASGDCGSVAPAGASNEPEPIPLVAGPRAAEPEDEPPASEQRIVVDLPSAERLASLASPAASMPGLGPAISHSLLARPRFPRAPAAPRISGLPLASDPWRQEELEDRRAETVSVPRDIPGERRRHPAWLAAVLGFGLGLGAALFSALQ